MTNRGSGTQLEPANPQRAFAWFLVAVGFLFAGLVVGTMVYAWRRELAWIVPAASFVGYVFSFRRGMLLRNPEIDRSWRYYVGLDGEKARRGDGAEATAFPNLHLFGSESPTKPELRIIR